MGFKQNTKTKMFKRKKLLKEEGLIKRLQRIQWCLIYVPSVFSFLVGGKRTVAGFLCSSSIGDSVHVDTKILYLIIKVLHFSGSTVLKKYISESPHL